jgi:hypothetical protein
MAWLLIFIAGPSTVNGGGLGFDHFHHPWERVDDDQDPDGDADNVVKHPVSTFSLPVVRSFAVYSNRIVAV